MPSTAQSASKKYQTHLKSLKNDGINRLVHQDIK